MQILGYLPAPAQSLHTRPVTARYNAGELLPDARYKAYRPAVEYIFDGEVIDEQNAGASSKPFYSQSIDPANQQAISRYTEQQSLSQQRGRFLDIFI